MLSSLAGATVAQQAMVARPFLFPIRIFKLAGRAALHVISFSTAAMPMISMLWNDYICCITRRSWRGFPGIREIECPPPSMVRFPCRAAGGLTCNETRWCFETPPL